MVVFSSKKRAERGWWHQLEVVLVFQAVRNCLLFLWPVTEDPCLPLGNDDLLNYTRSLGTSNNRLGVPSPR